MLLRACQAHNDNGKILADAMAVIGSISDDTFRATVSRDGLYKAASLAVEEFYWTPSGPRVIAVRGRSVPSA